MESVANRVVRVLGAERLHHCLMAGPLDRKNRLLAVAPDRPVVRRARTAPDVARVVVPPRPRPAGPNSIAIPNVLRAVRALTANRLRRSAVGPEPTSAQERVFDFDRGRGVRRAPCVGRRDASGLFALYVTSIAAPVAEPVEPVGHVS